MAFSFAVEAGETVAIVGESGCGKSVTANSILRLVPEPPGKIAGAIRFQGRDLLKLSEREMRGIRGTLAQTIISDSSQRHPMSPDWLSDQGLSS
jgi:peptide/nickel transport system ATP-binding protein